MNLKNKSFVIATHLYTTGPATDLRDYLISQKVSDLLFISHPLFYSEKLSGSALSRYDRGQLVSEFKQPHLRLPSVISYVKDIFLDLWWVIRSGKKWDLYIGSDNLNAVAGLLLKQIGIVRRSVYYVIDYNPRRFSNPVLNSVYHWLDRVAVRGSDETWNLSPRMEEGRKKYFSFSGGRQVVVPVGIWWDRIHRSSHNREKYTLVFVGHITKKQGLDTVIRAVPEVIRSIRDFKFLVIGGGDYLQALQDLSDSLNLKEHVRFTGYIEDHHQVETMISRGSAAIAMYDMYVDGQVSFTYFADPAKLKLYTASGLPVIVSNVPYNAQELTSAGCGRVVENTPHDVAREVIQLFKDQRKLNRSQAMAVKFSQQYNWPSIFTSNLSRVLD